MAKHPDLSRGWQIVHQDPPGSICDLRRGFFPKMNWRDSSFPSDSEPFSNIVSSLARKLRVSYWVGNCLEKRNREEMLEQDGVEGFSSRCKLGVGITSHQELPPVQVFGGRLLCPAPVKALVNSDSPGQGWRCSACLSQHRLEVAGR